jgi:hypothetical protein
MGNWQGPALLGGDFNIIRSQKKKSNGLVNFNIVGLCNDWIDRCALIDIKDSFRSFTWSNN